MPVLYPNERQAAIKSFASHLGHLFVGFERHGVRVGVGGETGAGVDLDVGIDVVMSAGDEAWDAMGVGVGVADGVGFCSEVIVDFGCGFSDDAFGDGVDSILDSSILDILLSEWMVAGDWMTIER